MKRLMKLMLMLLVAMNVLACGGGGGDDTGGGDTGSVTVTGRLYNQAAVASLGDNIEAAAVNSPMSILNALAHDVKRLNPIRQNGTLMVEVEVKNLGPSLYDLSWFIGVEKADFITSERWECWECFSGPGVTACNEAGGSNGWSIEGGYFYNSVEAPALPVCDNSVAFISGACHDVFPAGLDCDTPSYEVRYVAPGNGLWMPYGTISWLQAGHTYYGYAETTLSPLDIRTDHLAWAFVNTSEGDTLAERFYILDVIP